MKSLQPPSRSIASSSTEVEGDRSLLACLQLPESAGQRVPRDGQRDPRRPSSLLSIAGRRAARVESPPCLAKEPRRNGSVRQSHSDVASAAETPCPCLLCLCCVDCALAPSPPPLPLPAPVCRCAAVAARRGQLRAGAMHPLHLWCPPCVSTTTGRCSRASAQRLGSLMETAAGSADRCR